MTLVRGAPTRMEGRHLKYNQTQTQAQTRYQVRLAMAGTTVVQPQASNPKLTPLSTTSFPYALCRFCPFSPVMIYLWQDERDDFDEVADYVFQASWR